MTFPHPDMLQDGDREKICSMLLQHASRLEIRRVAEHIRKRLNPHPAGQQQENIPRFRGKPVFGMQHKYRETVLFFPLEVR